MLLNAIGKDKIITNVGTDLLDFKIFKNYEIQDRPRKMIREMKN